MKFSSSISVVMPAFNEAENLPDAIKECVEILSKIATQYDVTVVDDCSTDKTQSVLTTLQKIYPCLQIIRNKKNLGCHPSSLVGFKAALGEILILLPADKQIPSSNIPKFLNKIEAYDLVCSYRRQRADAFPRRFASHFYNIILRFCFGINLHDTHSAIAVKQKVVKAIINEVQSPSAFAACEFILRALMKGFLVTEIEIEHLPRVVGKAKGANFRDAFWTPINLLKFWLLNWHIKKVEA